MKRFNDLWNPKYFNLSSFAKSINSQNQEDGVIESILKICGYDSQFCVDIGAADGIWCSNTRNLILQGWGALMVEWEGELVKGQKTFLKLQENYKDNSKVVAYHEFVTKENIQGILDKFSVPVNLDLLNIDIDGKDLEVWEGITKHRPNLVIIEFNYERTDFKDFYYNPTDAKGGASLGTLNKLAEEKGYDYLCVEMCNAFFIERGFGRKLLK